MAPHRFPIFSFPRTVAEQVLQNVPIAELFAISLLSKRAFALIKGTPMTNCEFDVVLSASPAVYAYCEIDRTDWNFYGKRDSGRQELEDMETRTVSVSDGSLVFAKSSENSYGCSSASIQDVIQFIQWICSLFNCNVYNLTLESSQFQHLKEIQSVEELKKSKQVFVRFGTVTHEEMIQVIEGFETDTLSISCDPGPDFKYDRPICFKDFRVYTGSWAKGPMVLNFHSEHVTVMNVDVTEEDVIAFLDRMLENRDGCGNVCSAVFFRVTRARESEFVYDNRTIKTWDLETITNALPSYEQEDFPRNVKRFWRRNRTNFIDVGTSEADALALEKDRIVP